MFLRNNYSDLFGPSMLPVLEEMFWSEVDMHPQIREQLFKTVSTDRDIWQSSEMHDMPLFQQVQESQDYTFKRPLAGVNKTMTVNKYGLGFSISEEAVDDGKFDFIADAVKKLARSAKESQEIAGINIFNNGFTSETSADGQFVFDTDHSLPSGLSFRNRPTTGSDLSPSTLDAALADFETQQIGDSGIIYNMKPKVLLVPSSMRRYALEITGSDLKADTNNNNMNSLKPEGLRVISSPHLTDSDAWFLLASPEQTGLRIVNRKPLATKASGKDVGFINDSIYYKSSYRETLGVTTAYGIYGNPGI
jgi:hypothetical protein